jgi:hypothetical protein
VPSLPSNSFLKHPVVCARKIRDSF